MRGRSRRIEVSHLKGKWREECSSKGNSIWKVMVASRKDEVFDQRFKWRVMNYGQRKARLDCEGPGRQGLSVHFLIRVMSELLLKGDCSISTEVEGGKLVRRV